MSKQNKIDYVELAAKDMAETQKFFTTAFGWRFKNWGDEYMDSSDSGIGIGFYNADLSGTSSTGGALVTIYSEDLEAAQTKVVENNGKITKEIFAFPGGRRFQFVEPSGNEFAVWSDK